MTVSSPLWAFVLLFAIYPLTATWVGNPGQPTFSHTGIVFEETDPWSLRIGYFGDYVYRQKFKEEFDIRESANKHSQVQFWTQAGLLTLNFQKRFDFYAIVGGSRLEIDRDISTDQQFAWGAGGKVILFHKKRLQLGIDLKYFQSRLTPDFFLHENLAYNLVSDFQFNYKEFQGALGLCYRLQYLAPYASATYLFSRIEPRPLSPLVRFPTMDMNAEVETASITGSKQWGLALGTTLLDQKKATIALEWRVFNQNSIDVSGEIQF